MVMSKVLQQPANGGAAKADLYELLGVARDASEKQIKVAYYKKARDLHPDKNSDDPNAEARFKAISEAYQVLSDPERRKMYDHLGAAALEQSENLDNFKFFVRGLFGGEEFEEVLGDVCTLPAFKEMMDAMITGEAGKKQDAGEAERALEQERREAAALAEEEYVRELTHRPRCDGQGGPLPTPILRYLRAARSAAFHLRRRGARSLARLCRGRRTKPLRWTRCTVVPYQALGFALENPVEG